MAVLEPVVPMLPETPSQNRWEVARRLRKNKGAVVGLLTLVILFLIAVLAPMIAPYDPYNTDMNLVQQGPTAAHILGCDDLGRDLLSRIIWGTQVSLQVGVFSVGIALFFGVVIGLSAGYYGGWIDNVLMRAMDIMLAFPALLLAIALMSVLGPDLVNAMIAIGIVAVPEYARIVRGSVLSVRNQEYVEGARALGVSDPRIMFRYVLPNVMAPIIVRSTLGVSEAILETAALGFLGLGVRPPIAEWGSMLNAGRAMLSSAPHIVTFPGIAITIAVLAFNLFGDGLRDALDPRLKN